MKREASGGREMKEEKGKGRKGEYEKSYRITNNLEIEE